MLKLGTITFAAALGLTACTSPISTNAQFIAHPPANKSTAAELFKNPPRCAIILPVNGSLDFTTQHLIELVVLRHFQNRLARVVSPLTRNRLSRESAYNLNDPIELIRFSNVVNCDHGLLTTVHSSEVGYAFVLASRHLDLTLELTRFSDQTTLWKARHSGERNAGGLPTGPIALAVNARQANLFLRDGDGLEALIEDVVRKLSKTFPLG
tara:strand:+ start:1784 stop:2413 length:630 start_codon:yes stop_codon:yes gene_type:complete